MTLTIDHFKNPDSIPLFVRDEIERQLEFYTQGMSGQLLQFAKEHINPIVPFGCVLGVQEGQPAIIIVSFMYQPPIDEIVAQMRISAVQTHAIAFCLAYDGYTTFGDPRTMILNKATKSDSIVSLWRTVWGSGKLSSVRYKKTETSIEQEPAFEFKGNSVHGKTFEHILPFLSNRN